jgi:hypothetical protein
VIYLSPWSGVMRKFSHPRLGVMVTPASDRGLPPGVPWGADNGCFSQGDKFTLTGFFDWLEGKTDRQSDCLFVVAPDVLGDAAATWERSLPVLSEIRARGFPSQVDWSAFDVLFIGGNPRVKPEWKRQEGGGYAAITEAKTRGKRVHVGRVNGGPFLRNLAAAGADSADGTILKHGPDRHWPLVTKWLDGLDRAPSLPLWGNV